MYRRGGVGDWEGVSDGGGGSILNINPFEMESEKEIKISNLEFFSQKGPPSTGVLKFIPKNRKPFYI